MPLAINPPRGCLYDKTYPQLLQFFEIPIGVSLTQEGAFKAIFFSTLSPPPRPLSPRQMLSPSLSLLKADCDQPLPPEHAPHAIPLSALLAPQTSLSESVSISGFG